MSPSIVRIVGEGKTRPLSLSTSGSSTTQSRTFFRPARVRRTSASGSLAGRSMLLSRSRRTVRVGRWASTGPPPKLGGHINLRKPASSPRETSSRGMNAIAMGGPSQCGQAAAGLRVQLQLLNALRIDRGRGLVRDLGRRPTLRRLGRRPARSKRRREPCRHRRGRRCR